MFLAWAEIRRTKVRFGLLIGAVALLVFLILFQYTIQNSLIRGFVGGVRNQNAPVLVFDVDGRRTPQASTISPSLQQAIRSVGGVGRTAALWSSTFPVAAGKKTTATTVVGYADAGIGGIDSLSAGRQPRSAGEAIANASDVDLGFGLGATIVVAPKGPTLTIVGIAEDIDINVIPTVFVEQATYLEVLRARNPAATLPDPNVIGAVPTAGVAPAELARRINAADENLDALTKADAADRNPGVASIRQSFNIIFVLFALVVPLVTGLFFVILTFQKASSLTLLRAFGAPARRLVASLLVQVFVVIGFGLALGIAGYFPLTRQRLGSLPLRFETTAVLGWSALLAGLSVISSLAAIRRVLKIDPIEATTGAGVRT